MAQKAAWRFGFNYTGNKRTWRTVAIMFYSVCANYLFLHLSYTLGRVVAKVAIYIIGDFLCNTPYISSTSSYYSYDRDYKEYEYYRDEGYFSLLGNFSAQKESDCYFRVRPVRRYL